jgi:hypothetical protein
MPNLYMGRGGLEGLFGNPSYSGVALGQPPMPGPQPTPPNPNPPQPTPSAPPSPMPGAAPVTPPPSLPPNVLSAQTIRPTGASQGYDPSYLQNLATSIGALFSRPQGNLSFNPLGNLGEISPSSGIGGNAPGYGAPLTWLQDALNGLGFSFGPPAPPVPTGLGTGIGGAGGGGGEGGRGGGIRNAL